MNMPYMTLLLFLFLTLNTHAQMIEMDGLTLDIPESWTVENKQATMYTFIPAPQNDSRVTLFSGIKAAGSVEEQYSYALQLANKDWKVEKNLEKGQGATADGSRFSWQESLVSNTQGAKVLRLLLVIFKREKVHLVTLYCGSENSWNILKVLLSDRVQSSTFSSSLNAPSDFKMVGSTNAMNMLHCYFDVMSLKLDNSETFDELLFSHNLNVGSFYHEVPVKFYLNAKTFSDPVKFLSEWLVSTEWNVYSSKNSKYKISATHQFVNKNGYNVYYCLVQESLNGIVNSKRPGVLIEGKGWTMAFASCIGHNDVFRKFSASQKTACSNSFDKMIIPNLLAMASSVKWKNEWSVDTRYESSLKSKKTYRYRFESTSSFGSTVTSSERYMNWDFYPDNKFKLESDRYFNATSGNLSEGLGTYYLDRHKAGKGRYKVVSNGKEYVLICHFEDGRSSLHRLKLSDSGTYGGTTFKGFSIDGQIEGKYFSSNSGKFRED